MLSAWYPLSLASEALHPGTMLPSHGARSCLTGQAPPAAQAALLPMPQQGTSQYCWHAWPSASMSSDLCTAGLSQDGYNNYRPCKNQASLTSCINNCITLNAAPRSIQLSTRVNTLIQYIAMRRSQGIYSTPDIHLQYAGGSII